MMFLRDKTSFLVAGVVAFLAAAFLPSEAAPAFARLAGPVPPLITMAFGFGLGLWALGQIASLGKPVPWAGIAVAGMLFGLVPIAIDLAVPFPRDVNVLPPAALLFYPAAGFLAEVAFHLMPLAVMALALRRKVMPPWAYAPAVFAEPVFQVALGGGPAIQSLLVAVHVSLFSAAQLWVFRRHGFLAMYAMRLAFYLVWHILWGTARLPLLFP